MLKRQHIRQGPILHRETGRGLGKSRAMARAKTNLKRRDTCLLVDPAQEQLQVRTTNLQVRNRRRTHRNRTIAKTHRLEGCPWERTARLRTKCHAYVQQLDATFVLSLVRRLAALIRTYGHVPTLPRTQQRKMTQQNRYLCIVAKGVRRPKGRIIHPVVSPGSCRAGRTSTTGERISHGELFRPPQDLLH